MYDTVKAVLTPIRAALALLTPVPTLYVNERSDTAALPHAWIYNEDEAPSQARIGTNQDVVVLHLWARNRGELQSMEDAVAFLDDYPAAPSTGNAYSPHYRLASKPPLSEGAGVWHTTARYIVLYGDKRKLG